MEWTTLSQRPYAKAERIHHYSDERRTAMKCTTLGIDLAKNVFQLHGVDERGRVTVQKRVPRS